MNQYVIIDIEQNNVQPDGDVLIIKANPVRQAEGFEHLEQMFGKTYFTYSMNECDETEVFMMPYSEELTQRLVRIARRYEDGIYWTPNMREFMDARLSTPNGIISIHKSLTLDHYRHSKTQMDTPLVAEGCKQNNVLKPFISSETTHANNKKLKNDAQMLSSAIKTGKDKEEVYQKWQILAKDINAYFNYTDIPYVHEVSEAMFLYVREYKCNKSPEEVIRVLTTLCLLKRSFDLADESEKTKSAMRLSIFIYKKYAQLIIAWYYTLPRNVAHYSINDIPKEDFDYYYSQMRTNYFAIKKYLYDFVTSKGGSMNVEDSMLLTDFEKSNSSMLSKIKEGDECIDLSIDGKSLLDLCCNRINENEKLPMWITYNVPEITSESLGMIPSNFILKVSSFEITEPYMKKYVEGEIMVKLEDGFLLCDIRGLDNRFFPLHINQRYRDVFAAKKDHLVDIALDVDYARLQNKSVTDLNVVMGKGRSAGNVIGLIFSSVFGDGPNQTFSTIACKGECEYIDL